MQSTTAETKLFLAEVEVMGYPDPSYQHPSSRSKTGKHMVVCGEHGRCAEGEQVRAADDTELHEVRCCFDAFLPNWQKRPGCEVWGESELGRENKCYSKKTFIEAVAICSYSGVRLCTQAELEAGCTQGSGCKHDDELIWSGTTAPPSTLATP